MAVVLGAVFGLRLRAKHHLVDEGLDGLALHSRQRAVEMSRADAVALRELDSNRPEKRGEIVQFLCAWRVMSAIDQWRILFLQRFRRRDIGEDHKLLDQPVERRVAQASGRR